MLNFIEGVGTRITAFLERLGRVTRFSLRTLMVMYRLIVHGNRSAYFVLFRQIRFTGLHALPIVCIISVLMGTVVITLALPRLQGLGVEFLVGEILNVAIIREMGPLLLALLLTGRSGTAIAGELGTMRSTREIECLECLGIDPLDYLVAPRVLALTIASVCLIVYFNVMALFGGWVIAYFTIDLSFGTFWKIMWQSVTLLDFVLSVITAGVFGLMIGILCSFNGLGLKGSTTEVPIVVSRASLDSILCIFVLNGIAAILFYL